MTNAKIDTMESIVYSTGNPETNAQDADILVLANTIDDKHHTELSQHQADLIKGIRTVLWRSRQSILQAAHEEFTQKDSSTAKLTEKQLLYPSE